jgi:hypothetical protein
VIDAKRVKRSLMKEIIIPESFEKAVEQFALFKIDL